VLDQKALGLKRSFVLKNSDVSQTKKRGSLKGDRIRVDSIGRGVSDRTGADRVRTLKIRRALKNSLNLSKHKGPGVRSL